MWVSNIDIKTPVSREFRFAVFPAIFLFRRGVPLPGRETESGESGEKKREKETHRIDVGVGGFQYAL